MDNILTDWHVDGRMDDEEFFAYKDLIGGGTKLRVQGLRHSKLASEAQRTSNFEALMNVEIVKQKASKKRLQEGYEWADPNELGDYYPHGILPGFDAAKSKIKVS